MADTKFWTYRQNNSGGYFVRDEKAGVGVIVIIEARDEDESWERLEHIGDSVDGFWVYCPCCGERWHGLYDDDGTDVPTIYGKKIDGTDGFVGETECFVHYYNGEMKKFEF